MIWSYEHRSCLFLPCIYLETSTCVTQDRQSWRLIAIIIRNNWGRTHSPTKSAFWHVISASYPSHPWGTLSHKHVCGTSHGPVPLIIEQAVGCPSHDPSVPNDDLLIIRTGIVDGTIDGQWGSSTGYADGLKCISCLSWTTGWFSTYAFRRH